MFNFPKNENCQEVKDGRDVWLVAAAAWHTG